MKNPILIIIAKEPQVGTTKTRLSPPLELSQAAALFEALLEDTIDLVASLESIDLAVAVTPPESTGYFENKTPEGTLLIPVTCVDIGDCLKQVFAELFEQGYPKVLAFNSDGPSLPIEYIHQAVTLLETHDVVFGPSDDGGYYLVGLNEPRPGLFADIQWSTSQVLEQSLANVEAEKLRVTLLPEWYDVDTADDLERLLREVQRYPKERLKHTRRYFAQQALDLKADPANFESQSGAIKKKE